MDLAADRIGQHLDARRLVASIRGADNRRSIAFPKLDAPVGTAGRRFAADATRRKSVAVSRVEQLQCERRQVDRTREAIVRQIEPRVLPIDDCRLADGAACQQAAEPILAAADRLTLQLESVPIAHPPAFRQVGERVIRAQVTNEGESERALRELLISLLRHHVFHPDPVLGDIAADPANHVTELRRWRCGQGGHGGKPGEPFHGGGPPSFFPPLKKTLFLFPPGPPPPKFPPKKPPPPPPP